MTWMILYLIIKVKIVKNKKENGMIMGKLIIDGNKVYTVDEACMKRKNLTLAQIREQELPPSPGVQQAPGQFNGRRKGRR